MKAKATIVLAAVSMMLLNHQQSSAQQVLQPAVYGQPVSYAGSPYQPVSYLSSEAELIGSGCDDGCGDGCGSYGGKGKGSKCGPDCDCLFCQRHVVQSRMFGSVEYTQWYNKGRRLPALMMTAPAGTLPADFNLGNPDAQVIVGDDPRSVLNDGNIGSERQAGGRVTLGMWLDDCRCRAIGVRAYGNEGYSAQIFESGATQPLLGVPYFDTDTGTEQSLTASFPGLASGSIQVGSQNEVYGGDIFGRQIIDNGNCYRLDLFGGYQYTRINDDLTMQYNSTLLVFPNTSASVLDVFDAENDFHGGALGLYGEIYRGCWTFSMLGKIAVGNMNQQVTIRGTQTLTDVAGGTTTYQEGLFAASTNSGVYSRTVTTWSPEASIKASYALTDKLSLSVGYTFIYWTRVALAGDQVDRNINGSNFPPGPVMAPLDPQFTWRDTDFWVQTIDIGGVYNF